MLFNSLVFLYWFLPVTCIVFWCLKKRDQRLVWLTIMSYVFYAFWNFRFCAFLAISTMLSYFAGLGLLHWQDTGKRRLCLILPIVIDLLILAYFKYFNFALQNVQSLADYFHVPMSFPHMDVILPVGISFYTFHTISYVVDSYKGIVTPTSNFWKFTCYVSLFSQLVAGPIVRYKQVDEDLENIELADRKRYWNIGWSFFAIGMIEKVIIADTIASLINSPLSENNFPKLSTAGAWLCMLGYTYQLFFDFAGYSNMAVGLGYMFAIHIPQNFNSPYKAIDISDFWRRWHISLSSCLRDYLYIPLGGNRGPKWSVWRNIMITMLIGGLWHGANWTFVLWGAYHGVLLLITRQFAASMQAIPNWLRCAATFFLVMIGWVIFRSTDIQMAGAWLSKLILFQEGWRVEGTGLLCAFLVIAALLSHWAPNTFELKHRWHPVAVIALTILFIACIFLIVGSPQQPFLYFEF